MSYAKKCSDSYFILISSALYHSATVLPWVKEGKTDQDESCASRRVVVDVVEIVVV